jgi:hypothetical protein
MENQSLHKQLIFYFAKKFGWLQNEKAPITKYEVNGLNKKIIPDIVSEDAYIEVEVTGNKSHYSKVKNHKRRLIVCINSYSSFDEVVVFGVIEGSEPRHLADFEPSKP